MAMPLAVRAKPMFEVMLKLLSGACELLTQHSVKVVDKHRLLSLEKGGTSGHRANSSRVLRGN